MEWVPSPGPPWVEIDPAQVDRIVTNFCVKARDAVTSGGSITVEAAAVTLDEEGSGLEHPDAVPGAYAVLRVTDDGHGMDPEVLSRIFDPFFTTKPPGKGTGVGLSSVHGIARRNGFLVAVRSVPGRETVFAVHLPLAPAPPGPSS